MANPFTSDAATSALLQSGLLEPLFRSNLRVDLNLRSLYTPELLTLRESRAIQIIRSRRGTVPGVGEVLAFGSDPTDTAYGVEQWPVNVAHFGKPLPLDLIESGLALADLLPENLEALAHGAGKFQQIQARFPLFNTAVAGQTTTDTTGTVTSVHLRDCNGFCFSRGANGQLAPVSAANTTKVWILHGGSWTSVACTGVVLDSPITLSDAFRQIGPGVITIPATAVTSGDLIVADSASMRVISGGGMSIDTITSADYLTGVTIKQAVARLRLAGARVFPEGGFRCILSPDAMVQLTNDNQVLLALRGTGLDPRDQSNPNVTAKMVSAFGCAFIEDAYADLDAYPSLGVSGNDYVSVPQFNAGGVPLSTAFVCGSGNMTECWKDPYTQNNPAGFNGTVGEFGGWAETGDGITTNVDRIRLILRSPIDKMQRTLSSAWSWFGSYDIGTDFTSESQIGPMPGVSALAGSNSAFKRCVPIFSAR
jgi:hypothetical protein